MTLQESEAFKMSHLTLHPSNMLAYANSTLKKTIIWDRHDTNSNSDFDDLVQLHKTNIPGRYRGCKQEEVLLKMVLFSRVKSMVLI